MGGQADNEQAGEQRVSLSMETALFEATQYQIPQLSIKVGDFLSIMNNGYISVSSQLVMWSCHQMLMTSSSSYSGAVSVSVSASSYPVM